MFILPAELSLPLFLVTLFISGMVILPHLTKLERLRQGTESHFRA